MRIFSHGCIICAGICTKWFGMQNLVQMMVVTEKDDDLEDKIEPKKRQKVYVTTLLPEEVSRKDESVDFLLGFSDFQEEIYSSLLGIQWEQCGEDSIKIAIDIKNLRRRRVNDAIL